MGDYQVLPNLRTNGNGSLRANGDWLARHHRSSVAPETPHRYHALIPPSTDEIAYLGVLDGGDTVFIARSGHQRHMASGYMPGTRMPAQVTAAGMIMLACGDEANVDAWLQAHDLRSFTSYTKASKQGLREELMTFKRQGWAISEQQLELNFRGIAVPLLDRNNSVHGAISMTMPINREETDHAIGRILPVLQEAAQTLRPLL